jgi:hypothetical protein
VDRTVKIRLKKTSPDPKIGGFLFDK